jgi:PIN domain nuclease of toxin-antitoxin system
VKYLLDAHTFLWWSRDNSSLSANVLSILSNSQSELLLSTATIWELSIKCGLGKLPDYQPFMDSRTLSTFLAERAVQVLGIDLEDISTATQLPQYHRDPFDRMVIAQAQRNQLIILGKDELFRNYDVNLFW